ncbi:uncharacterized protein LOC128265918 [Drosophila gunungcola]|uniref:uncharacterized protein LOC128265918 n=1 Tax=Drosophila gunungcola TaxID=103775 RepID=UPI0022E3F2DF|nr:uncharacterized protein LOC128265918 [Drosophila gunungcola]
MWIPRARIFLLFFLKATYYVSRQPKTNLEGAKQPRCKLYDKYTCIIKDLRASGLRSKESQQPTTVHDDGVKRDEQGEVKEDLEWLRGCLEPEVEATERWIRTSDYRLHSLRVTPTRKKEISRQINSTTIYLNEFKVQPWGYRLVYHALHAFYPHQSLYPWLFIQKAIYEIETQWDPQVPCVETKIKEFRNLDLESLIQDD